MPTTMTGALMTGAKENILLDEENEKHADSGPGYRGPRLQQSIRENEFT